MHPISTLEIAKKTGIEHRAVMILVDKYSEDLAEFGEFAMETSKETGGRPVKIAWLNKKHFGLLITLMKNSKTVVKIKKELIQELHKVGTN